MSVKVFPRNWSAFLRFLQNIANASAAKFSRHKRGSETGRRTRAALLVGTFALLATGAAAQSTIAVQDVQIVDQNGVNLATGAYNSPDIDVQVGTSASGLTRQARFGADALVPTLSYALYYTNSLGQGQYFLNIGFEGTVYRFLVGNVPPYNYGWTPIDDGPYTQFGGTATLTCSNTTINRVDEAHPYFDSGTCVLRLADGASASFGMYSQYGFAPGSATTWTKADGEVVTVDYYSSPQISGVPSSVKAVRSSLGWMLKYDYATSPASTITITGVNTTSTYCDANDACTGYDPNAPQSSETINGSTRTIYRNGQLAYTISDSGTTRTITSADGVVRTVVFAGPGTTGAVQSVSIGGSTWTYSYSTDANYIRTVTVTEPDSKSIQAVISASGLMTSRTDEAGRKTQYSYDAYGRLQEVINPDATYSGSTLTGGYTLFAYDSYGNTTSKTIVPKDAGTDTTKYMVTSATFPCAGPMTCNKPQTVTDENGVTTTYAYDSATGNVLTETGTPPATGVAARETQYIYSPITPQIKTASGYAAQAPVSRLTEVHSCEQSYSLCNWAADDRMRTISYGADNANPTNKNVVPVSTTLRTGGGAVIQTTTWTYDGFARIAVEDGPASGSSDTTYFFYDNQGRVVGSIGSDPDGAGARPRMASKIVFDADGHIADTYTGTVTATTAAALNAMTDLSHVHNDYSTTTGLLAVSKEYSGNTATIVHLTQYSYDSLMRQDCVATRLNSVDYPALPASACTLGTTLPSGNHDQITKYAYNALGGVTSTISGYGTGDARTDFSKTFDLTGAYSTGAVTSVVDARGNKTTYTYDKFDRLQSTCYPLASSGSTSSTTDCEQITYASVTNGGVTHMGTRPGASVDRANAAISYSYDGAGRLQNISGAFTESFTYNNFGQILTHSANGQTSTLSYNALGWLASDAQPVGTVSYTYDNLGRRTKMTWPSGDFVSYVYDDGGELIRICDNVVDTSCTDAVAVVTFGYDDFGRRTSVGRGSGYADSYSYDTALRLQTLAMLGASSSANTVTLGYSTADQIVSRTQSNAAFAAPAPTVGTTNYSANGLNQLATAGPYSPGYDARGNMTWDGSVTYGYDAQSHLVSASTGISLVYDAMDRLASYSAGGVATKFLYDGTDIIGEYDASGVMLRRYIHGPGQNEPLVWLERNTGGTYDRRYLVADERGSIVAVTNAAGSILTYISYDAYGVPSATNPTYEGRFGYTGQVWLGQLSLYYYGARMYAPTLRRFMQADPSGYGAGLNLYAYVGGDPMNKRDSSGLCPNDNPLAEIPLTFVCVGTGIGFGSDATHHDLSDSTLYYQAASKEMCVGIECWKQTEDAANSKECADALAAAPNGRASKEGVQRADDAWLTLVGAAANYLGITPAMLAAQAVFETDFRNIPQRGGGLGVGVFQIDLGQNPSVTREQALDVTWAANFTAATDARNISAMIRKFSDPADILHAAITAWNVGAGRNITGNPATIDDGASPTGYGKYILDLMNCFPQ